MRQICKENKLYKDRRPSEAANKENANTGAETQKRKLSTTEVEFDSALEDPEDMSAAEVKQVEKEYEVVREPSSQSQEERDWYLDETGELDADVLYSCALLPEPGYNLLGLCFGPE